MSLTPTRGERNKNPGNLQRDATKWQGMCSDQSADPRFVIFNDPEDGIRALCRVLLSYSRSHGLNTIKAIINRWAPPVENNTTAYVGSVAQQMGIRDDIIIDLESPVTLEMLTKAIHDKLPKRRTGTVTCPHCQGKITVSRPARVVERHSTK